MGAIVDDWGPRDAVQGVGANCQPDGASAIWIRFSDTDEERVTRVRFGEYLWRPANIEGSNLVTALVPPCVIQRAGVYPLSVVFSNGETMRIGRFLVMPA